MMHNTYISCSSSITSFRTKFIAFNDYPIERCPLNYNCSCCCSFPVNSTRFNLMLPVNINPNLLYGLRQSTLINFPPSRRLVLGSSDRYSSIYDVGRCRRCCCCCCGGGGEGKYLGRSCKEGKSNSVGKIRGRVIRREHERERERERERDFRCNALGDAEAMLSLLSGEGGEESGIVRRRRKRLNAGASVLKKQNVLIEKDRDVKVSVLWGSGYLESKCKKERLVSSRDHFREDSRERRGEPESITTDDSLSGSDKCETDNEIDVKHERFIRESSANKRKDSRKMGGIVISEVKNDVLQSYKDEKDQKLRSSRGDNIRMGSSAEWDWRKKSEKKLTDESTELARSREESIMRQSKLSQVNESSSFMASSSKKQFSNVEDESNSDVSSRRQSRSRIRKDDSVTEYTKPSGQHEHSVTDLRLHGLSKSHIKTGNQVSEHLVSGNQREQSTSVASSSGQSKSRMTIDNQVTEYLKSSWEHNQSSQTNRQDVESTATTMRRPIPEKEAMVVGQLVQETGCDYCRTCGKSLQENESEVNIEHHAEVSEIHGDARLSTSVQSQSDIRRNKQEMGTSSSQTLVKEGSKEWNELHSAVGQVDARKNSGKYSETLESDYSSYDQGSLRSQKQPEMQIKILGDNLTSVESRQDVKKLKEGSGGRAAKEIESQNLLQTGINDSQVHSTSVEINRPSASGKINDEKIYSTSKLKSVKDFVEKHKLVEEAFVQTGNFSGDAISQTGAQQVTEVEVKNDLQVSVMPPSFQLIELNSSGSEPESSLVRGNSTGRTTRVDDGGSSRPQARRSSFADKANKSGTELVEDSSPEDAISSLERMHESSAQIVGEFVETMRHDSSASKTSIDKELSQVDKKHMLTGSTQLHVNEALVVKQHSSHVSGGSGTKIVVDDTQDAKVNYAEEALESKFVARRSGKSLWNIVGRPFRLRWGSSSVTQKSPVKSSQHSLPNDSESDETWFSGNEYDEGTDDRMQSEQTTLSQEPTSSNQSLIMRTATRSRQENRTKKESASMPQKPVSEQSLIKENATRRRKKDRIGKEQRNTSQEPALDQSPLRSSTKESQKGDSGLLSLDDRPRPLEGYVSSPASASQAGSISGSVSIGSTNSDLKMTQQTLASSPLSPLVPSAGRLRRSDAFEESEEIGERFSSTSEQRESSPEDVFISSAGQLRRSDAFEESKKARINEELISATSELKGDSVDVTESVVPALEETDTQRKQRKLLRSKQVLSDRFDEWEEAFKRENELRKIDEIFMREALAEALKAADSWEVPVGAVLVQNEKIIARGYNLVEALRDSTAHAEMICIREASNTLRTWRLSETTLYVTLEPCPMCAGAILQARIGTLVWGAPNKLLGADGSWIRLFPQGVEGEVHSEVADKPAAPAHPFHPNMKIRRGVLESECAQAMQQFFQLRRKKEKEKDNKSEEEGQPPCLPVAHKPVKLLRKMHGVFHKT